MSNEKINVLLNKLFINSDVFYYTIDYLFQKIIIFSWNFIIEISLVNKGKYVKKTKYLYISIRKFEDINNIYKYVSKQNQDYQDNSISIINKIIKYDFYIYNLLIQGVWKFFLDTFKICNSNKKILLILKWWWMEETIEKSFIAYCNYNKLNLTVLYKFWLGYWGQQLNQDGFFSELKANFPYVKFLYNESFDDDYVDWIVDDNTEVFSFQYDYKWKYKNLNMIVLSSVTDYDIDCNRYKNIFSCYRSKTIWYSTDKFINTDNTNIYKMFNPQNINLLDNYTIIKKIDNFILTGWMWWCRDFSILNSLDWKYKGVIISDEIQDVKNFISMYRWIQNYYWFFWAFILSQIWVFCHLEEFNDDDRSKMIATSICSWKPVVVPYNDWLIVKDILDNKLWVAYKNWDLNDLEKKIRFFTENDDNIKQYSNNCLEYSKKQMDITKFINDIFENTLNK